MMAQNINTESLAREYYREGSFEKAAQLFENVYKKKKVKSIYDKYVDCLIQIQEYKKAEKTIKSFYKKTGNPIALIDLGELYSLQGDISLANETFEKVVKQGKKNKRFLPSI